MCVCGCACVCVCHRSALERAWSRSLNESVRGGNMSGLKSSLTGLMHRSSPSHSNHGGVVQHGHTSGGLAGHGHEGQHHGHGYTHTHTHAHIRLVGIQTRRSDTVWAWCVLLMIARVCVVCSQKDKPRGQ